MSSIPSNPFVRTVAAMLTFLLAVLLTAAPAASQERSSSDIHEKVLAQASAATGADILSGVTELDPEESLQDAILAEQEAERALMDDYRTGESPEAVSGNLAALLRHRTAYASATALRSAAEACLRIPGRRLFRVGYIAGSDFGIMTLVTEADGSLAMHYTETPGGTSSRTPSENPSATNQTKP